VKPQGIIRPGDAVPRPISGRGRKEMVVDRTETGLPDETAGRREKANIMKWNWKAKNWVERLTVVAVCGVTILIPAPRVFGQALPNGAVYLAIEGGDLVVVDRIDGHELWRFTPADGATTLSSVAVGLDGTAYFGTSGSKLCAVTPPVSVGGQPTPRAAPWPLTTGDVVFSSPAIDGANNTVYVGSQDGNVYAVVEHNSLANTVWPMFRKNLKHTAGP
jgi:hypothetical protein